MAALRQLNNCGNRWPAVAHCSVLDGAGPGLLSVSRHYSAMIEIISVYSTHTHTHTYCENRQQRRKNMKCTLQLENNFARDYDKGSGLVGELGVHGWDIWVGEEEEEESDWIGGPSKTAWAEQLIKRQRGAFSYLLHNILLFITSALGACNELHNFLKSWTALSAWLPELPGQWNAFGRLIPFNVLLLHTASSSKDEQCGPIVGNPLIRNSS